MAIDPKAAAAAAQAAAEAARAAAEAAAAAAAEAAARTTSSPTTPTLADSGKGDVLEQTGATMGDTVPEAVAGSDLRSLDSSMLGGADRNALASLPGLESAVQGAGGGGLASPFDLSSSFQSNQNPGFGTESISTVFRVNIETDDAELVNPPKTREAVVVDGETWLRWKEAKESAGDSGGGSTTGGSTTGGSTTGGSTTGGSTTGGSTTGGSTTGGSTTGGSTTGGSTTGGSTTGGQAPNPSPVDPVVDDDDEEEEDDDDVIVVSNDSGAGGSTGVAKPAPDDSGGYSGSWNGITPINPGGGDDDIVAGATGHVGSSPGGWAINPGAEGFVAGRETDLRDAKEWYGGVSQPDPLVELAGDPAMLDQGMQIVDPNTVNPSDGQGSTSDAGAQASTAYRTSYAPAQAGETASATGPATADQVSQAGQAGQAGGATPEEGLAVADAHAFDPGLPDPADSMAPLSQNDDFGRDGHGGERGREFGQSQGKGHGRSDDQDDDDTDE